MKRLSLITLTVLAGMIFLYLSFATSAQDKAKVSDHKITKEEIGKSFTCVMCNMKMKVSKNTPALDYQGKAYYFCSVGEKESFSKQPDKYISSEKSGNKSLDYIEHKITAEELGKKATCSVTKESFTISKNTPAIEFNGEIYYFCCPGCIEKFINSQKGLDSLKVAPDSLHHNKSTEGTHKHKGCC
jgi:YHS domain-containing protein